MRPGERLSPAEVRAVLDVLADDLEDMRMRQAGCPPIDVLAAAQRDALPAPWQTVVSAHLARSGWSRALLAGATLSGAPLDALTDARLRSRIAAATHPPPRWRRWRRAALGLLFVLCLVMTTLAWRPAVPPLPLDSQLPRNAGVQATALDSRPTGGTLPPLPFQMPGLPPDVVDDTRGLDAPDEAYRAALAHAYEAYRAGDYRAADLAFRDAAEHRPSAFEVLYYGGVTRLALGREAAAVDALTAALASGGETHADGDDLRWALAVAAQRAGDHARALVQVNAVCHAGGPMAIHACGALAADRTLYSTPIP